MRIHSYGKLWLASQIIPVARSEWQNKPIPQELHEQWKRESSFKNGLAILPGKIWHRKDREGYYLIAIDLDNETAIK